MHGLPTIHQMNRDNEEAQRIMAKYEQPAAAQDEGKPSAAQRIEVAQQTMKRILNGARG